MTQSPCLPELPKPAELLSCPFCGGAAHCHDYRGGAGYWQVECQDCDATTDGRRIKSDAIEVWNRRACYEAGSAAADQCRQCQCPACTSGTTHASDCSVHGYDSGAGILRGPCDCGAAPTQGAEEAAPQAVVGEASEDGMVAAFPVIALGHGLVEIGDATWEGLNALFFGKNGADVGPIGSKRDRNDKAQDGETLALITFANLKGLEQVEDALSRVRRNMEASQGEAK